MEQSPTQTQTGEKQLDVRQHGNGHAPLSEAERELAYEIKRSIDRNGSYLDQMNNMSSGLAVGRQVSQTDAFNEVEGFFSNTYGQTPKQYLDDRYEKRRQAVSAKLKSRDQGRSM